jgi:NAD+ diphosphatase
VTFPHVELAADPHDRAAARRSDEAWLEQAWARTDTGVLVVAGNRLRPRDGAVAWEQPDVVPGGQRVFLGEHDGRARFAVVLPAEDPEDPDNADDPGHGPGDEWVSLRGVLPHLAGDGTADAPLVLHAVGIAEWLAATRFCDRCGSRLEPRMAGHELVCVDHGHRHFPRLDPAVIMAVAYGEPGADDERLLLGRQAAWPEGRYSTLAGFVEPGETLEDAVRREVAEETGVRVGEVTYFGNQPWPLPSSLMLGFLGRAESTEITVDGDEVQDARWLTREQMRQEAQDGTLLLPSGVSISRSLVEHWYGGPLPGSW